MLKKKYISVCLTPKLFDYYNTKESIVVIIDLLRATSVISTAFEYGIKKIIPVTSIQEALNYQNKHDHILAAERNTKPVKNFDYGNSPYHYMTKEIEGKTLVLTTTNGTKAINLAKNNKIITASYVNFEIIVKYLKQQNQNIIILCSGWKNLVNIEDSILAGHLAQILLQEANYETNCDSLFIAKELYMNNNKDFFNYLSSSAYRQRNNTKEVLKDTKFCLNPNIKSDIIPTYYDGYLKPIKIKNI